MTEQEIKPCVLAECFVTCGGYYDMVQAIMQVEHELTTADRRTLLAMSEWVQGRDPIP